MEKKKKMENQVESRQESQIKGRTGKVVHLVKCCQVVKRRTVAGPLEENHWILCMDRQIPSNTGGGSQI